MNKLIKVILFLIVGMVQVFAWGGLRGDTLAKELDEAVLNRSFYLQQREQRITQLKDMFLLSKISLWQEYEINHQLYEESKKIQQDSAIYYIKRNMEIASFMKDTHASILPAYDWLRFMLSPGCTVSRKVCCEA